MASELYLMEVGDGYYSILLCDDRSITQMPAMTPAETLIAFSELDYAGYRKAVRWLRNEHPLFEERIDIPVSDLENFAAEAMPDGATVKTSKAAVGFRYCTKLFSLEKKYIYADVKARKEYRQNVVLPILEEYFAWLKSIHPEKGGKLEDAVRYSLNRKQQLMAFLDYGDVPISNNLAENAIRPFVVGRKNWLFCDSVKGAESSAIVYSLVETAKANGMEPYGYLLLVLSMLPYLGKSPTHEELEKLMPWHPAVRHREHIRK